MRWGVFKALSRRPPSHPTRGSEPAGHLPRRVHRLVLASSPSAQQPCEVVMVVSFSPGLCEPLRAGGDHDSPESVQISRKMGSRWPQSGHVAAENQSISYLFRHLPEGPARPSVSFAAAARLSPGAGWLCPTAPLQQTGAPHRQEPVTG